MTWFNSFRKDAEHNAAMEHIELMKTKAQLDGNEPPTEIILRKLKELEK